MTDFTKEKKQAWIYVVVILDFDFIHAYRTDLENAHGLLLFFFFSGKRLSDLCRIVFLSFYAAHTKNRTNEVCRNSEWKKKCLSFIVVEKNSRFLFRKYVCGEYFP